MKKRKTKDENRAIAVKVCDAIATSNRGVTFLCKEHGMDVGIFFDLLQADSEINQRYARAREAQADYLADEILEIADDSENDTIKTEKGDFENKEWINRSRLKVDARKWIASKLKPKKYGDKIDVTTDGEKITPKETFVTLSNGTKIPL